MSDQKAGPAVKYNKTEKKLQSAVDQKILDKKYLRYLHGKGDKEAFQGYFQASQEGPEKVTLKGFADKKEQKKFRKLLKLAKKNSKSIKTIKIIGISAVIGILIAFNIFFKNQLIEKAMEFALSKVTGATVDIDDAYLNFSGSLGFAKLQAANPQKLDRNIFELGQTRIDIAVWPLFSNKVIINEISGQDLRWDTLRAKPGKIVGSGASQTAASSQPVDIISELHTAGIDIDEMYQKALAEFASFRSITQLAASAQEASQWEAKIKAYERDINAISSDINSLNLGNITLDNAPLLISKGKAIVPRAEQLVRNVSQDAQSLKRQVDAIRSSLKTLNDNFDSDWRKLQSQLSSGSILGNPISEFVETYARNKVMGILSQYELVYKLVQNMEREQSSSEKATGYNLDSVDQRRHGRSFYFPSTRYPDFAIKRILFTLGGGGQDPRLEFLVRNINSDGDVWHYPWEGRYTGFSGGVETEANFYFENRSKAPTAALAKNLECVPILIDICQSTHNSMADIQLRNQPIILDEKTFSDVGLKFITEYKGKMESSLHFEQIDGEILSATANVQISQPQVAKASELSPIENALAGVLERNDIQLGLSFQMHPGPELIGFKLTSNLDAIISRELQRLQAEVIRQASAELRRRLQKQFGAQLGPIETQLGQLEKYSKTLSSESARSQLLQRESRGIESKVNSQINRIKQEAARKAAEEARKAAESVLPKAPPISVPRLPF